MNADELAFVRSYDGPRDERYFAGLARLATVAGRAEHARPGLHGPTAAADRRPTPRPTLDQRDNAAAAGLVLARAADVRPASVSWAWQGRLPLGSLTLLVGQPGLGKTMLACEVAARASRGQLDGDLAGPCDALYLSAEDSPAHTLVPRLMAAGAGLERIHFLTIRDDAGERGLTLPDDVDRLAEAIRRTRARLVIVDPVMAHLATRLDVHRDHSIRRALAPLARLADELGVAVLAVAHLNKAAGSDLFARVGGSIGLTAAARSVLVLGADPEADEGGSERILAHGKSNLSPLAAALRFRVEGRTAETPDGPIATAGLVWAGEAPSIGVADLLAATGEQAADGGSSRSEATAFLRQLIGDGSMPARDARRAARNAGIADRTLDRAKRALGVIARHEGQPGQAGQGWTWALPPKDASAARRTPTPRRGVLRENVALFGDRDRDRDRDDAHVLARREDDDPQASPWLAATVPTPSSDEEATWTA
ncbi:MAG: AAA family ATPase [Chloroflexi bacterium]|nr:AAA family ATPase [Chloroflexota bacterium]